MIKYSIIIPVYNCEKYIEKCLESLLNQNYDNYEIIVVDDGSKDSSLSVCKRLADKNDKIKVFSKENGGVSSARNFGIDKAEGQYVLFVDSDDFVSNDYLKVIDENITDDEFLTFFNFDYIEKKDNTTEIKNSGSKDNFLEKKCKKDSLHDFVINTFFASPCNKVYKSEIVKNKRILFDTDCVCFEDLLFNLEYLKYITKTNIIENSLYYYRMSESVNLISKRKWGEPFLISKKLVNKIKEVCSIKKYKIELSTFLLYSYTAFMTELKYIKATNEKYSQLLDSIVRDKDFVFTLTHLKNVGKKLLILKILLRLKLFRVASKVLDGMIK